MQTKLGQKLREERLNLKMSQIEFADFLQISRSSYERIENDKIQDLKLECMLKILKKVNIPLDVFIPIEILNRYCIYREPKKDNGVKKFLTKEFSKIVTRVERKFISN